MVFIMKIVAANFVNKEEKSVDTTDKTGQGTAEGAEPQ